MLQQTCNSTEYIRLEDSGLEMKIYRTMSVSNSALQRLRSAPAPGDLGNLGLKSPRFRRKVIPPVYVNVGFREGGRYTGASLYCLAS